MECRQMDRAEALMRTDGVLHDVAHHHFQTRKCAC